MSINSEIERIKTGIDSAYSSLASIAGADTVLTVDRTVDNLVPTINTIKRGFIVNQQQLNVTSGMIDGTELLYTIPSDKWYYSSKVRSLYIYLVNTSSLSIANVFDTYGSNYLIFSALHSWAIRDISWDSSEWFNSNVRIVKMFRASSRTVGSVSGSSNTVINFGINRNGEIKISNFVSGNTMNPGNYYLYLFWG